jgi:hypothetical protein
MNNKTISIQQLLIAAFISVAIFVLFQGHSLAGQKEGQDSLTVLDFSGEATDPAIEGFRLVHPFPERVPFGEGEKLTFAIQYGLIYAGDATLEVRNIAVIDSMKAYRIISAARTSKSFDLVFKVRDRIISFMDYENLYSLRFEKHIREGKFKRDEKVLFDQQRHIAVYDDKEVPIPPNTQDFLSALYFFRTLDVDEGEAIAMANHTSGKNYPIFVKVVGRERVKVPAGSFDCIVVEPVLQTTAIFENKGKLTIWMTDDNVRMPVLMRSKVVIGAFEAVLKEYSTSNDTMRVLPRKEIPQHGE